MKTSVEGLLGPLLLEFDQQNCHPSVYFASLLLVELTLCKSQHDWTNHGALSNLAKLLFLVVFSQAKLTLATEEVRQ